MSTPPTLDGLVEWLVRQRVATLDSVWSLTLPDVRRAARVAAPQKANDPPTLDDLAALMRAFPDQPDSMERPHGENLTL